MSEKGEGTHTEIGLFTGGSKVLEAVVKDLARPVYDDGLKPVVTQLGKTLETAGLAVNAVLAPIRAVAKGVVLYEEGLEKSMEQAVARKLLARRVENVQPPPPNVAIPALEGLRLTWEFEELREMYFSLIATSMDPRGVETAHPGFAEIIKQLSPSEARMIEVFASSGLSYTIFRHVGDSEPMTEPNSYRRLVADSECTSITFH